MVIVSGNSVWFYTVTWDIPQIAEPLINTNKLYLKEDGAQQNFTLI